MLYTYIGIGLSIICFAFIFVFLSKKGKGCLTFTFFILTCFFTVAGYGLSNSIGLEATTETVISSTVDRELLYFCNIPVQEISGNISGSSIAGNGKISGNITTSNELSYWYKDKDGNGIYASASTKASKIVFLKEDASPFVRVITYKTQEIQTDKITGKQQVISENSYPKYEFHLPIEIMQYNLE